MNLMCLMMNLGIAHGQLCLVARNSKMNQGKWRPYDLDLKFIREKAVAVAEAANAVVESVDKMEKEHPLTTACGKVI